MPALVAGIHAFPSRRIKDVDGRDEPGHDDADRSSWYTTRSEVEVDADLSAVHCERAGRDPEQGHAIKAAIKVLGLNRPARHEHPFRARSRGPAGLGLA